MECVQTSGRGRSRSRKRAPPAPSADVYDYVIFDYSRSKLVPPAQMGSARSKLSPAYVDAAQNKAGAAHRNAAAYRFLAVTCAVFVLFVLRRPDSLLNP